MFKGTIAVAGVLSAAMLAGPMGSTSAVTAAAHGSEPAAHTCSAPGAPRTSLLNSVGTRTNSAPAALRSEQSSTYSLKRLQGADATRAVSNAGALIDRGQVKVHFPSASLVRGDARAYTIDSGGSQYTSVTYRIAGTGSAPMSNVTILMDASGKPVQHAESVFTKGSSGNFHLTTYVDGVMKRNNENTGIRYISEAQQSQELQRAVATPAAEGDKNTGACLAAVLGVSGAVGAVIAYACAGSCSVPMTPVTGGVCAACVGGFAVVGGASITAIANCF